MRHVISFRLSPGVAFRGDDCVAFPSGNVLSFRVEEMALRDIAIVSVI